MYVPPTRHRRRPSPGARTLSQRIDDAIRDHLANNPGLSEMDVLQALELARQQRRGGACNVGARLALAVGVAAFVLGLAVFLAGTDRSGMGSETIPWVALLVGVAVVIILVARIAGRRG